MIPEYQRYAKSVCLTLRHFKTFSVWHFWSKFDKFTHKIRFRSLIMQQYAFILKMGRTIFAKISKILVMKTPMFMILSKPDRSSQKLTVCVYSIALS